ncbi:MAG: TolC family protein [Bacteroidetes bacterium]|nr:TolC family protein [Bacteroidota bacterium]
MIKRVGIFLFAFFFIQFVEGQKIVWSYQQCIDTAIKRNISINQTRLSNEVNKVNLKQSKALRIPGVSGSASEGMSFGHSWDPIMSSYVEKTYNSTSLSINGNLTLFNGFQNTRTILQNKLLVDAGESDIDQARDDIILNITTAYLEALLAYEILDAAIRQEEATTTQVDRTRKLVNAGKVPELNLLQIQSQLATDNLAVVNAQGSLDIARVTLMQLMEVPVIDSFDIVKPVIAEPSLVTLSSNTDIYQKALSVVPDIRSAEIRSNSALLGIRISEGARYPRLNMTGGVNSNYSTQNPKNYSFSRQWWENLGQNLGLSLSIPIYSNRQIRSNIDRAKINLLNTRLNEQSTRNQLRKIIEQSYTDLKNSWKKFEATKDQLRTAEVSYQSIEKKFNVGLMTAIDFLVEKNNFAQAQSNLIQSKYNFIFKSKILDFYQGKPIQF